MHRALLLLALFGCSKGASDADCAKVRQVVGAVPRRYRDTPVTTADREQLSKLADPAVAQALRDSSVTYARLESLCTRNVTPREHDCTEVRRVLGSGLALPPKPGEPGVFDPSLLRELARFDFRDAEVGKAVRELADTAWTAYTPQGTPPASLTRLAALCPGLETP